MKRNILMLLALVGLTSNMVMSADAGGAGAPAAEAGMWAKTKNWFSNKTERPRNYFTGGGYTPAVYPEVDAVPAGEKDTDYTKKDGGKFVKNGDANSWYKGKNALIARRGTGAAVELAGLGIGLNEFVNGSVWEFIQKRVSFLKRFDAKSKIARSITAAFIMLAGDIVRSLIAGDTGSGDWSAIGQTRSGIDYLGSKFASKPAATATATATATTATTPTTTV